MSDNIKEMVKRLRTSATTLNRPGGILNPSDWARAADALEAMAGEVERLTNEVAKERGNADQNSMQRDKALAERDRLRAVLDKIAVGDYERSGRIYYINKLRPSKNDVCEHGRAFWDDCGNCCSNFARKALGGDAS